MPLGLTPVLAVAEVTGQSPSYLLISSQEAHAGGPFLYWENKTAFYKLKFHINPEGIKLSLGLFRVVYSIYYSRKEIRSEPTVLVERKKRI